MLPAIIHKILESRKMHLTHIKFKPTKKIGKNFSIKEATEDLQLSPESKDVQKIYAVTDKLSDALGFDMFLDFDDSLV